MTNDHALHAGLRRLARPRQTWRRLGGAAKFVLYTRLSIESLPPFTFLWMVVALVAANNAVGIPGWLAVLTLLLIAVGAAWATAVLELQPDLNTRPRREVRPVYRAGLGYTLLLLALSLLTLLPGAPEPTIGFGILVGNAAVMILCCAYLPWLRYRWLLCLVLTVPVSLAFHGAAGMSIVFLPLLGLFFLGTVALSVWTVNLMKEVEEARRTEASLKVTEERLRFSQELHDTLGQHLAAISLKSELALALARRGDERLTGELEQLQQLSRTSMSEMREVVEGYRSVNLATEITGARSLLADAEVTLETTGDALDVAEADRELAAWFVREATTNVLRHADATTVHLELGAERVRMSNDGANGELGRLSGLGSLRRRAREHGARLLVEKDGGNFAATLIPAESTE